MTTLLEGPRCMQIVKKGPNKGKPCTRPAGYQTPHPGVGPCNAHGGNTYTWGQPPAVADEGAESETVAVVKHETVYEQIERIRKDPDLFDGRRELAIAVVMLNKSLENAERLDFGSATAMAEVRQWIALLNTGRGKVQQALAARDYYMTLDQAIDILNHIGEIWHEGMMEVIAEYPEMEEVLKAMEKRVSARFATELYLPDPSQGTPLDS